MKIVIYEDRNRKDHIIRNILNTIYLSLKKHYNNFEVIYVKFKKFELIKCDYAIIWNVFCKFKKCTEYRKLVEEFQKKNNNKLIIAERGFIRRDVYFSFGYDNISNFGKYPNFPNDNLRLKKLNLNLKKLNYDNNLDKYILFCSQVPWDTQVQYINYEKWMVESIKEIKKYSNRKIVFRRHPAHKKRRKYNYYDEKFLKKNGLNIEISTNNLNDDLKNSYCVIAYNSTVLVDSILAGIPIISGSKSSIIYELSTKKISEIENLQKFTLEDIENVLSNISYKQWSIEEFNEGEPFKYFF